MIDWSLFNNNYVCEKFIKVDITSEYKIMEVKSLTHDIKTIQINDFNT